jgi:hypothetical protein
MFVILVTANRDFAHLTSSKKARGWEVLCLILGSVAEEILRHSPCPVLPLVPEFFKPAKLPSFANPAPDVLYLH